MEGNDEIREYYNLTARETADAWYDNPMLLPTIKEFLGHFPARPRILDLGCGPGHESKRLAREGANVVGIDFSPDCIGIARERCPQCHFEIMDFRSLDAGLGRFDGIFAAGSLIHLPEAELSQVFTNITMLLKIGGLLLPIFLEGNGVDDKMSNLEVRGRILRRTVFRYSRKFYDNLAANHCFSPAKEISLDSRLREYGWQAVLYTYEEREGAAEDAAP